MLCSFLSTDRSHSLPLHTQEVEISQGAFWSIVHVNPRSLCHKTEHEPGMFALPLAALIPLRKQESWNAVDASKDTTPHPEPGTKHCRSQHHSTRLCREIRNLLHTYTQPLLTPLYLLHIPLSCASFLFEVRGVDTEADLAHFLWGHTAKSTMLYIFMIQEDCAPYTISYVK